MSTETKDEEKVEGKKAGPDAPPVNIGWDSHKPVVSVEKCSAFRQTVLRRICCAVLHFATTKFGCHSSAYPNVSFFVYFSISFLSCRTKFQTVSSEREMVQREISQ